MITPEQQHHILSQDNVRQGSGLVEAVCDAGVPRPLSHHRLGSLTSGSGQGPAAERLLQILEDIRQPHDRYGALLVGVTSTGKSSVAAAAVRYAIHSGYSSRFIAFEDLVGVFQSEMNLSINAAKFDDFQQRHDDIALDLDRLRRMYEVLVIDDIFRADAAKIFRERIHALIRKRFDAGLYTIITSNISADTLREMDERLIDFLVREYDVFTFDEDDVVAKRVKRAR